MKEKLKAIDWDRVIGIIQVPLVFAAVYTASEIGCIGAILFGIEQPMALIKAGWVIGLLCGAVVMWLVAVRPKNTLLNNYEKLTDDLIAISKAYKEAYEENTTKRPIEGDEWKDAD